MHLRKHTHKNTHTKIHTQKYTHKNTHTRIHTQKYRYRTTRPVCIFWICVFSYKHRILTQIWSIRKAVDPQQEKKIVEEGESECILDTPKILIRTYCVYIYTYVWYVYTNMYMYMCVYTYIYARSSTAPQYKGSWQKNRSYRRMREKVFSDTHRILYGILINLNQESIRIKSWFRFIILERELTKPKYLFRRRRRGLVRLECMHCSLCLT